MSVIFAILSQLLLVFSLIKLENSLEIVLLLAKSLMIIYQVGCLILLRFLLTFSKIGFLWMYCSNYSQTLQAMLIYFITAPIIIVVLLIVVDHIKSITVIIKALKIILLLFFFAEYFGIFIVYLVLIWFEDLLTFKSLFLQNMELFYIAQYSALGSLVGYLKRKLNFIMFLQISGKIKLNQRENFSNIMYKQIIQRLQYRLYRYYRRNRYYYNKLDYRKI